MKEVLLRANITFLEIAKESFNFPLNNSIRTSFWLLNSQKSTFSEIQLLDENVDILKLYEVKIKVTERDFFYDKLKNGIEFKAGTYPNEIAYGKIIEVIKYG